MSDDDMAAVDPSTSNDAPGPLLRRYLVTALVVVLLGGAVASALVMTGGTHDMSGGAAAATPRREVPPLRLETVPASLAAHYRFASAHVSDYSQIPCWCGCEQFLGHRSLSDCFVRPDGRGWEAHAAGCGVCQGEAAIAEEMLAAGKSAGDIKVAVTERFGTTAITTASNPQ